MVDRFNEKIFIGISVILNFIGLYFIVINIVEYRESSILISNFNSLIVDLKNISGNPNLLNSYALNQTFSSYVNAISPREGVASYSQLIADLALNNNLKVNSTKVLSSKENYLEIQNNISGSPLSISKLISSLENNSPTREIQKAEMKIVNNEIELEIVVRNYIIK